MTARNDYQEFPEGALAAALNHPFVMHPRMGETDHDLPYLHVSDLLKTKADNKLCLREHVLRHFDKPTKPVGTMPAKMRLLWDTGNVIGDELVIRRLLETDPTFAPLVWGDWTCDSCGHVVHFSHKPNRCMRRAVRGKKCTCRKFTYKEVDLRIESVRLVGHPDLLLRLSDGTIIIYEIKTIDRGDVDFDKLTEPLGDHFMQASYYYWLLRKLGYKVSRRIRFLYIDRSIDNLFREKPYREVCADAAPSDRIQFGIDKCKELVQHIQKRTLPDRVCKTCTDTRTNKCSVTASCFGRRSNRIKPLT